jgi:diguanylate cyclase (GGDEF)-like protein/PAS domain S-box-containing protein
MHAFSDKRRSAMSALELVDVHEGLFAALADHAPVGVFATDAGGACVYANDSLCELLGRSSEQLLGDAWALALHPDDAEWVQAQWVDALAAGRDFRGEYRFLRPDGGVRHVEGSASAVRDTEGLLLGFVGCCVDLTARKLSDGRYRELFEHATDAIFVTSAEAMITSTNRAGEKLTGYGREQLVGTSVFDLIAPEDAERTLGALQRLVGGGENEVTEFQLIRKNGEREFVEVSSRLIKEDGRPVEIESIARDTSERHALEQKLRHDALHDPLTGLPNRTLFHDRLEQALGRATRSGSSVAVMLLDLDGFKDVNDSLGHAVGDELLVKLAPRLRRELRVSDSVARLGGDEFGFLFEDVTREQELVSLAERLLAAVADPVPVDHSPLRITGSLGITIAEATDTAETVLSNADTAMYSAKHAGIGGFEIYNDAMRSRLLRELALTRALATALGNTQVEAYYQPIVSLTDGRILALEALARWNHPEWGWIAPNEFIPIAEDHELIIELGERILGEIAKQATAWRARYPQALPLGIFVNISPQQLSHPDFVHTLSRTLEQHRTSPTDIGIEITERVLIDPTNKTLADNVDQLAQLGIRLSLDDFGTGYSSLAALKDLPLTALKIDRSFVKAIRTRADAAPICSAMIGLGHTLGLTVIAEGIETQLQADHMTQLGCDAAQGFHYARPQPAHQTTILLQHEQQAPNHDARQELSRMAS